MAYELLQSISHYFTTRHMAMFVGKLDTRLRSSQLHGELDKQIANVEVNFTTSPNEPFAVQGRDIINKRFEDSTPLKIVL